MPTSNYPDGKAGYISTDAVTGDVITAASVANWESQWDRASTWSRWDIAASSASVSGTGTFKDSTVGVKVDHIGQFTASHGVVVNQVLTLAAGINASGNSTAGDVPCHQVSIPTLTSVNNMFHIVILRAGGYRLRIWGYNAKAHGWSINKNGVDTGSDVPLNAANSWSNSVDLAGLAAGDVLSIQPDIEGNGAGGSICKVSNTDGVWFVAT